MTNWPDTLQRLTSPAWEFYESAQNGRIDRTLCGREMGEGLSKTHGKLTRIVSKKNIYMPVQSKTSRPDGIRHQSAVSLYTDSSNVTRVSLH